MCKIPSNIGPQALYNRDFTYAYRAPRPYRMHSYKGPQALIVSAFTTTIWPRRGHIAVREITNNRGPRPLLLVELIVNSNAMGP